MVRDSVTMVFRFVCHQKWRIFKCFCSLAVADFFLQKWLETAGILTYFKVETISAGKKIKAKPVFSLWRTAQRRGLYADFVVGCRVAVCRVGNGAFDLEEETAEQTALPLLRRADGNSAVPPQCAATGCRRVSAPPHYRSVPNASLSLLRSGDGVITISPDSGRS